MRSQKRQAFSRVSLLKSFLGRKMDGEPARWFLRFKSYCLMGRGRSLQAVVAQEKGLFSDEEDKEAPTGTESENISSDGASRDQQMIDRHVQHRQA
jgi:hypothetical protein